MSDFILSDVIKNTQLKEKIDFLDIIHITELLLV